MAGRWKRRRIRRVVIPQLDYETSARMLRTLARGGSTDRRTMLALADRALELVPDDLAGERGALERYHAAISAGRRIKVSVHPVTFTEPISDELAADIESAFEGGER